MMRRNDIAIGLVAVALSLTISAQSPPDAPRFEVVSIKPNLTGPRPGGGVRGERYTVTGQNALGLIIAAFSNDRILNAPNWASDNLYDIAAKAPNQIASGQASAMLLNLLRERFAFQGHRETRDLPVYRLTVLRAGTTGPRLRRSTVDCGAAQAVCTGGATSGKITFVGMTINSLARALTAPAGRPVLNETDLPGRFDVDLEWSNTLGATDFVSVFTAVQEQLGLRLVPATAPMEVVVVDHIEKPKPD